MKSNLIYALLLIALCFSNKVFAQPAWTVNPGNYNYSMTATGVLNLNYNEERDVNNIIGAFVGAECRGYVQPIYDANVDRYMFYLMIYSNTSNETISFQAYDASSDSVYAIPTTIQFVVNNVVGSSELPYVWSNPTLSSSADILTYTLPGQQGLTVIDTTTIAVVMPAGSVLTNLVASFTASPNAYVRVQGVNQVSGVTANNFSQVVNYHLTAADESATKDYYVYVSIANAVPTDISLSDTLVFETAVINSVVANLAVADINTSDTHTYSLVTGAGDTDNSSFTISGSTLLLNTTLNYEAKSVYSIRLKVQDQAGDSFEKTFLIYVTNENDETPVWSGNTVTLAENNPLQAVYTVLAIDIDSNVAFRNIKYFITSGNSANHFSIDSISGVVSLVSALDYETTTSYSLGINTTDGINSSLNTLQINITDVNDETPVYSNQTIQVLETKLIGEQIHQVLASDADAGSVLTYSITSGNIANAFSINASNGTIILNDTLNYEITPSYTLEISVFDGVNTGIGYLTINLVDVNDETPIVVSANISVNETAALNTLAHSVVASDADVNSNLIYSITSGNSDNKFTIVDTTGDIYLVQSLNYEQVKTYYLTVSVNDGVNAGTANIKINVVDLNDEIPQLGNETIAVSESVIPGSVVIQLSATDADSGSVLTYSITSGNAASKFSIDANTGELSVIANLDFETVSTYVLGITVSDGVNSTVSYVTINVQAVNDESPVVNSASVNVSENAIILQTVHQVVASDPDGGSVLQYSIVSGNTNSAFQIDPQYGIIKVIGDLNYETTPSYNLTVMVNDGLHQVNGIITVNILNENDEYPLVVSDSVTISENMSVGLQVLQVIASDSDNLSALTYTISAGNAGNAFAIQSASGIITLANTLNYENIKSYLLTVSVSDGLNITNQTFLVNVDDVNDVAPVAQSANIQVNETAQLNTLIHTVIATDVDLNSTLTYAIISGNSQAKFQINATNGKITLVNTLDFESTTTYTLGVSVNDGVNADTASIIIDVFDKNDEIPAVVSETVFIPENTVLGSLIHSMQASDADDNTTLQYGIFSGNDLGKFAINNFSGKITLVSSLDYEALNSYTLQIIVSDGLNDSIGTVTVMVTDVNDNVPVLSDSTLLVSETKPIGSILVDLNAVDADASSVLTYTIVSGNTAGLFSINANTGEIEILNALDYETNDKHILRIEVSDGVNKTYANVIINVLNEDDQAPVLNDTTLSVSEFASIGEIVGAVKAKDADGSATLTYSVSASNAIEEFTISNDGTISVAGYLDFETKSSYILVVSVSDGTNSSTANVTINIEDKNETEFKAANVFTPNNDAINDFWEINSVHLYRECKLIIYNPAGEIVYTATGYTNNWNGTSMSGEELPVGTYYYVVNCPNCNGCEYNGFVSIVR